MGLKVDIQKKLAGFELNVKFQKSGKPLALLGASDSGKSMTLRCIAGLEKPDYGIIEKDGKTIFNSFEGINIEVGKRKTGFIFQNYALFPNMTIYENIAFGLGKISKDEKYEIIMRELEKVHLKGLEKRYPYQLSGGQQQRAAIARALALNPEILLLDEPFSALDDHTRGVVVREIGEMLDSFKGVSIFVTHNMEEAYRLSENIAVISKGKEEAFGDKESIFKRPPTVETAKITGCKNIAEAVEIEKNRVFVKEWGVELNLSENNIRGLTHIGIRANHITITGVTESKNTILCRPEYISESPFRTTLFMNPINSTRENVVIQCEIFKKLWSEVKNSENIYNLYLKPEEIFTMGR